MEYPKSFVEKAKRLYPNWVKLHELLDKGSPFVEHLLYDAQPNGSISIVRVLNSDSLEDLQEHAKNELEKAELYSEFVAIRDEYRRAYNAKVLREIQDAHARGERLT